MQSIHPLIDCLTSVDLLASIRLFRNQIFYLMARLLINPNRAVCPDYASDDFAEARAQLTDNNLLTNEQAVIILRNSWVAANNVEKVQWQRQQEEDQQLAEQRRQFEEEDLARKEQEKVDEEEAFRKEDRKKNKFKYIPILDRDVPTETPIIPSSYATRKLDKGEYVELWYFTNAGIDDSQAKTTIDEEAMVPSKLADGTTVWIPATTARNAHTVLEDQDLSYDDFCLACPRFVDAMEAASWPADRVKMMALFWRNLQLHDYASSRDPLARRTLLIYQAEQRKKWHLAVKSPAGPYDLSRINQTLLERTRDRVYWEHRQKLDNERDYRVSSVFI